MLFCTVCLFVVAFLRYNLFSHNSVFCFVFVWLCSVSFVFVCLLVVMACFCSFECVIVFFGLCVRAFGLRCLFVWCCSLLDGFFVFVCDCLVVFGVGFVRYRLFYFWFCLCLVSCDVLWVFWFRVGCGVFGFVCFNMFLCVIMCFRVWCVVFLVSVSLMFVCCCLRVVLFGAVWVCLCCACAYVCSNVGVVCLWFSCCFVLYGVLCLLQIVVTFCSLCVCLFYCLFKFGCCLLLFVFVRCWLFSKMFCSFVFCLFLIGVVCF